MVTKNPEKVRIERLLFLIFGFALKMAMPLFRFKSLERILRAAVVNFVRIGTDELGTSKASTARLLGVTVSTLDNWNFDAENGEIENSFANQVLLIIQSSKGVGFTLSEIYTEYYRRVSDGSFAHRENDRLCGKFDEAIARLLSFNVIIKTGIHEVRYKGSEPGLSSLLGKSSDRTFEKVGTFLNIASKASDEVKPQSYSQLIRYMIDVPDCLKARAEIHRRFEEGLDLLVNDIIEFSDNYMEEHSVTSTQMDVVIGKSIN